MRGAAAYGPPQITSLKRARAIEREGWQEVSLGRSPVPLSVVPPIDPIPTLTEWEAGCGVDGVVIDIETAGPMLLCVGILTLDEPRTALVVPFRGEGGVPWYGDPADLKGVVAWLSRFLADPTIPKVFHNGQSFDVPYLQDLGFSVGGYEDDTLLMQHTAYAELPKGLEWCAVTYCGARPWKHLGKAEGEGK
jgi:hypothetical protein